MMIMIAYDMGEDDDAGGEKLYKLLSKHEIGSFFVLALW